jgi:hypothetical protein
MLFRRRREERGSAALVIRLDTPDYGLSFDAFFRAHGYVVDRLAPSLYEVHPVNVLSAQGDRARVERDIEAWQAYNSGASAQIME